MAFTNPDDRRRIDVHHHIAPPKYLAQIGASIPAVLSKWSLAKTLEDMDEGNVATSIVSVTQLSTQLDDNNRLRSLARDCNEYGVKIAADHPGRFGLFTALPLPDIEGSLREIEYGLDVLKADGVGMYTSYHDKWLGDPYFAPVFEELNRRKAVIYVHPAVPDCCLNIDLGLTDAVIEYGTDTTRAIARMIFSGSAQRYPDLRMIWSHAGGTMPFLIERFMRSAQLPQYAKSFPGGVLPDLQRFYYDTAQASNRVALTATRMVIPASHIVFGTDFPYRSSAEHVESLRLSGVFDLAELWAIDRTNFAGIVPKYAEPERKGL